MRPARRLRMGAGLGLAALGLILHRDGSLVPLGGAADAGTPAPAAAATVPLVPALLAPRGRPSAATTPGPGGEAVPRADALGRVIAAAGADHRWFLGDRIAGAPGHALGHQGPEMPSDAFRAVAATSVRPRLLAAFGARAWIIAHPPVPGAEASVFGIRLGRNDVHDLWYPTGAIPLTPLSRLPAGVEPQVAAATPEGPIVIAAPREPGGRPRLLRLTAESWIERPLQPPHGVPADVLAVERPLSLLVARVQPGSEPASESASEPAVTSDPPLGAESGEDEDRAGPPAAGSARPLVTVTLLLSVGPGGFAVDHVGVSGERQRTWTGHEGAAASALAALADHDDRVARHAAAAAAAEAAATSAGAGDGDGGDSVQPPAPGSAPGASPGAGDRATEAMPPIPPFVAVLAEVDGRVWLAMRRASELRIEPFVIDSPPATPVDGIEPVEVDSPPGRWFEPADAPTIEATLDGRPPVVIGGDSIMLLEGASLAEPNDPPRVRAWTSGGLLDLDGPLASRDVDPSVILRGPIIIGTGIFFAVISGVLSSRPGPRPPAIEGREASVGRRLSAALVDALAPLVAAGLVFGWTPDVLLASLLLLHPAGVWPWVGFTLLWSFATIVGDLTGRTPGRLLLRVRPVDAAGRTPGRGRLLVRFLVRTASVGFPPLIMFWLAHARSRGLHDLAAGTWVVRADLPSAASDEPAD